MQLKDINKQWAEAYGEEAKALRTATGCAITRRGDRLCAGIHVTDAPAIDRAREAGFILPPGKPWTNYADNTTREKE